MCAGVCYILSITKIYDTLIEVEGLQIFFLIKKYFLEKSLFFFLSRLIYSDFLHFFSKILIYGRDIQADSHKILLTIMNGFALRTGYLSVQLSFESGGNNWVIGVIINVFYEWPFFLSFASYYSLLLHIVLFKIDKFKFIMENVHKGFKKFISVFKSIPTIGWIYLIKDLY